METFFNIFGLIAIIAITSVVIYHLYMREHGMTKDTAHHVEYHM